MSATPTTALPLATLSPEGKAPKSRINSAADAVVIAQSLIYSNRERARVNAKVKGMLDNNPPYDSAKLKQNAQSYRANVNFGEGDSMVSAGLVPYYDLFAGAEHLAEVKLYLDNPDDALWKGKVISEEFDCLLKKYKAFGFHMAGVLHDFVAFGKGFVMWPNDWGWHFKRVTHNRVFVPDTVDATVEELELLCIRQKKQCHKLWEDIQRPGAAEAGWDKEAVASAIFNAQPEERRTQTNDTLAYEYVQQMMRDKDILEGTKLPTVPLAHLYVKEFDGKITHIIVEEFTRQTVNQSNNGPIKDDSPQPKFLFKKLGRYEHMREALCGFFFETLDGSWNGVKGLGHKIYAPIEIKNRLLCKTVDNAFLSGGITLQAKDAQSKQKTALVQAGDFNIIPEGYDVQNAQIFARSDGLIGTNQLLDQTIVSNTGIYRSKMDKPQGNPRTAKEVEVQFQNATTLSNSGVSRFYEQCDPFYEELFRRVTKKKPVDSDKSEEAEAVREFFRRCKKRGVIEADFKAVESVRAVRNIGNGSVFQRQQLVEGFTPFVPMLTEGGKEAWMTDLVAAKFGQGAVSRYMPEKDKQLRPNDQQAMAMLENAALKTGAPVAWTPTQNNVIHATEHLKAMAAAAASLDQGADPMTVLHFMEAAGPHVQIHLAHLQMDESRKAEYEALNDKFKQLAQFTDDLAGHVQDSQQEQQQQAQEQAAAQAKAKAIADGTDPEVAIKAAQAQSDAQLKQAKTAHQMKLKDETHRQNAAIRDLDFAQKMKQSAMQNAVKLHQASKTNQPKE